MSLARFVLVSLPKTATTPDGFNPMEWLEQGFLEGRTEVSSINLPSFKLSTLDQLVTQSDELAKIDEQLSNAVSKAVEIMGAVKGDFARRVEDKHAVQYIKELEWKSSKYRLDKPLYQIITMISQEAFQLESDLKTKYSEYQSAKTALLTSQRKQNGDLTIKALHDIVKPEIFTETEYLTTKLVVIPKSQEKTFLHSYERLSQFVVPRSAVHVATDSEYHLYAVTLFKKYEAEFVTACINHSYKIRDFVYSEELINSLREEQSQAEIIERDLKNDTIRLASAAYSDIMSAWFHIKLVRIYVESVLRYGLPPDFVTAFIKLPKDIDVSTAKDKLRDAFGHIGKRGFELDGNGKIKKDGDAGLHEFAAIVDLDYEPFVLYDVELK